MSAVIAGLVAAGIGTAVAVHGAEQSYHAQKQAKKENKRQLKKAEDIQKAGELSSFNSAQRAGRISASRGSNTGSSGTILGGGQSLSGTTQGTQAVGAKTLLGQ